MEGRGGEKRGYGGREEERYNGREERVLRHGGSWVLVTLRGV